MKKAMLLFLLLPLVGLGEDFSLLFSGLSFVQTPDHPSLNPGNITAELWVKPVSDNPPMQILLQKGNAIDDQFTVYLSELRPGFYLHLDNGTIINHLSQIELQPQIWHHLCLMFDGQNAVLSVNGVPDTISSPSSGLITGVPYPLFISSGSYCAYQGSIDEVRIANRPLYEGFFDPFTTVMNDILPFDLEIPGWQYGTGAFDHQEADDSTSLFNLIDGEALIYLRHNFQYAIRQYYYGEIGGQAEPLIFWLTDQGDSLNAAGLYHDPYIASGEYLPIANIGTEARLDTSLLFDYVLETRCDRFYLSLTASKENDPLFTEALLLDFGENAYNALKYFGCQEVDSSVVVKYSFAEGSGNIAIDSSFYQNHGIINGAQWVEGCDFSYPFYILSATADDGDSIAPGIDDDDKVTIRLNVLLSNPPEIDETNINSLLTLSNGHSWLSGSGSLGNVSLIDLDSVQYYEITLSTLGGPPTIAVSDTICPSLIFNSVGKEIEGYAVITGDFGAASIEPQLPRPNKISLSGPYPNPFNNTTVFTLNSIYPVTVEIEILDILGRTVGHQVFGGLSGEVKIRWNSGNLSTGLYFAKISLGDSEFIKKLMLIK